MKNLVISFTSSKEWKNSKFSDETIKFIQKLKIKNSDANDGDYYNMCIFIIVFPDNPIFEGKFQANNNIDNGELEKDERQETLKNNGNEGFER